MYFLYCLFLYPKKLAFKKPSNRSNLAAAMLCLFWRASFHNSPGIEVSDWGWDTSFGSGFGGHQPGLCGRGHPGFLRGRGMKFTSGFGKLFGLWWIYMDLYGPMNKNLQAAASAMMEQEMGNSLTSTPCRRTILLQWHALLKVLAGSVGA